MLVALTHNVSNARTEGFNGDQADQAARLQVQITNHQPAPYPHATSRSPNRRDQQHERVATPLTFEEPVRWGFLFAWFLTAFFSIPE
jgi:flagellar basal body rod protein FlgG